MSRDSSPGDDEWAGHDHSEKERPMTDSAGATITRAFAARREVVFVAWTEPQHFAAWFGGSAVTVPADSVEMDVRPGGTWKATMHLPGDLQEINWFGEYVEVD